jgi:hypothetical protein
MSDLKYVLADGKVHMESKEWKIQEINWINDDSNYQRK